MAGKTVQCVVRKAAEQGDAEARRKVQDLGQQ